MSLMVKVPAMIVGELRTGLYGMLGQAAWDVSTELDMGRCTCHPEFTEDIFRRMDSARALLELIGWAQTGKPEPIAIDLGAHRWAFMSALERALIVGCEDIEAADRANRKCCKRSDEDKRDRDVVCVLALRQYLDDVESQFAALDMVVGCES